MYYVLLRQDGKIAQVCMDHQPENSIEITVDIASNPDEYIYQNGQFVFTPHMELRKQAKIAELLIKRDEAIEQPFTSATTGHTYYWTKDDKDKFHGQITVLSLDPSITSADWLTIDTGKLETHSRDQLIAAFREGCQTERDFHTKFYQLKSLVLDPSTDTPAKLDEITW